MSKNYDNYEVTILIDGLNDKEREVVTKELKGLKIKYRKVRGIKDEQNVFIRLADTMAGFLRDMTEKQAYTNVFIKELVKRNIVNET